MKRKALILGATPSPSAGPWVDISDGAEWRVEPLPEHNQKLKLVIEDPRVAAPVEVVFNGQAEIVFSGKAARVEILRKFDGDNVTIVAEECAHGKS